MRKGDDALSALLQDVLNLDELHAIQKDVMEGRQDALLLTLPQKAPQSRQRCAPTRNHCRTSL